jgi:acyl-CoA reductase-like NAD-dependent aldehyde dehydrogenase
VSVGRIGFSSTAANNDRTAFVIDDLPFRPRGWLHEALRLHRESSAMTLPLYRELFIAGSYAAPQSGEMEAVLNPATGETFAEAPVGGLDDLEAAIAAARESFDRGVWRSMTPRQRVEKMQRFHDYLLDHVDAFVPLIIAETGALAGMAREAQFGAPMKHFRYYLEAALRPTTTMALPEVSPNPFGTKTLGTAVVQRDPVGVVAAITAYNYPCMLNLTKIVPALLMGNSVVLKPSPYTPFEALFLGAAAKAAGLPDGVFNVITGGADVGRGLTIDDRVDLITFTGSDAVGAAIAAQAAPSLKRMLLELGGKSASIVCADANMDRALAAGLNAIVSHAGQACVALSRQIVHNSVRSEYVEKLGERLKSVKIGDPVDPSTRMGPLIRNVACERTAHYVASALNDGGSLIAGGKRPSHLDKGFFFEPTLFDGVDNSWTIAREEIFGPVGVVIGFDSDEEAIAIANDTKFGLSGAIFSANTGRAFEMAQCVRSGGVNLNGGPGTMLSDAPFGGVGRSGHGREMSTGGLLEFTQQKTIGFSAA